MTTKEQSIPIVGRAISVAAAALLALLPTSCSVLYSTDDLRAGSGTDGPPGGDAGVPVIPDAIVVAPGTVSVVSISPSVVIEGQGSERAIPIVLFGGGFKPEISIRVVASGAAVNTVLNGSEPVPTVSPDGSVVAFTLKIPVITGLDKGELASISFEIEQDGVEVDDRVAILTLQGRDELVVSEAFPDGTGSVDDIDPDGYSSVDIDIDLQLSGDEPAEIRSFGPMSIDATLSVDGMAPLSGDVGLPGPGGCVGGFVGEAGGCVGNGGKPTTSGADGGGGGGGHQGIGGAGNDDGDGRGGDGGDLSGNQYLIPLADEGGGGGGGASGGDNNPEAMGGGGGGILHLISNGLLTIGRDGLLSANGGNGGNGVCNNVVELGSGGGGAGGAILIQAYGGVDDQDSSSPRVEVNGGLGGALAPQDSCGRRGGKGSLGRVRLDFLQSATPPFMSGINLLTRGPAFANVPSVVITPDVSLAIVTEPSRGVTVTSSNPSQPVVNNSANSEGNVTAQISLLPGINEICVYVAEGFFREDQEPQCVNIAYVP